MKLKRYKKNRPVAVKLVKESSKNQPLLSDYLKKNQVSSDKKEKVETDDYKYPWEK